MNSFEFPAVGVVTYNGCGKMECYYNGHGVNSYPKDFEQFCKYGGRARKVRGGVYLGPNICIGPTTDKKGNKLVTADIMGVFSNPVYYCVTCALNASEFKTIMDLCQIAERCGTAEPPDGAIPNSRNNANFDTRVRTICSAQTLKDLMRGDGFVKCDQPEWVRYLIAGMLFEH